MVLESLNTRKGCSWPQRMSTLTRDPYVHTLENVHPHKRQHPYVQPSQETTPLCSDPHKRQHPYVQTLTRDNTPMFNPLKMSTLTRDNTPMFTPSENVHPHKRQHPYVQPSQETTPLCSDRHKRQHPYVQTLTRDNTTMFRPSQKTTPLCSDPHKRQHPYVQTLTRDNTPMFRPSQETTPLCSDPHKRQHPYVQTLTRDNTCMFNPLRMSTLTRDSTPMSLWECPPFQETTPLCPSKNVHPQTIPLCPSENVHPHKRQYPYVPLRMSTLRQCPYVPLRMSALTRDNTPMFTPSKQHPYVHTLWKCLPTQETVPQCPSENVCPHKRQYPNVPMRMSALTRDNTPNFRRTLETFHVPMPYLFKAHKRQGCRWYCHCDCRPCLRS